MVERSISGLNASVLTRACCRPGWQDTRIFHPFTYMGFALTVLAWNLTRVVFQMYSKFPLPALHCLGQDILGICQWGRRYNFITVGSRMKWSWLHHNLWCSSELPGLCFSSMWSLSVGCTIMKTSCTSATALVNKATWLWKNAQNVWIIGTVASRLIPVGLAARWIHRLYDV